MLWRTWYQKIPCQKTSSANHFTESQSLNHSQSFDNLVRCMASPQVAHFRILTKQQITHCSCYVFTLGYARSQRQTEWIPVEAQESGYMCQIAHGSPRSIRLSISVAGLSEKKCVELHHVCESRCFTISWLFFHHFHYHHDQQQQHVDLMKLLSQVHILICCGQIISMSSELCSNSKQAPPSPRWNRDEICVGVNHHQTLIQMKTCPHL